MRKFSRKLISVIMVLCVVTGLVPVTHNAISASSAFFEEDFSSGENMSDNYAFGQFVNDGIALDEYENFDRVYDIGKALSLNSGKFISFGDAKAYYDSETDYSLTEFDLYLDKRSKEKSKFIICLSTTYGDNESFVTFRFDKGEFGVQLSDGSVTKICSVEENKWNHFEIKIANARKDGELYYYTVQVKMNGTEVYLGEETRTEKKKVQLPYHNALKIANRSNVPKAYIDNVSMTFNGSPKYEGMEKLLFSVREAEEFLSEFEFMSETASYKRLKAKADDGLSALDKKEAEKADECAAEIKGLIDGFFEESETLNIRHINFSNDKESCRIMPEQGKITTVEIENKSENPVNGMIVTAFYDDGVLVECNISDKKIFESGLMRLKLTMSIIPGIKRHICSFGTQMEAMPQS